MSWVRKGKGKGQDEVSTFEEKPEYNLERMESANPNKCHQLCGSLEQYRPLNSLLSVNPWSSLSNEDIEYNNQDIEDPPGLFIKQNSHRKKMPHVKKWTPTREPRKVRSMPEVKGESKYCGMHNCIGHDATCRGLSAGGFKSPGRCSGNDEPITKAENVFELSNIEELIFLDNIENDGSNGNGYDGDYIDFTVDSGAADTVANEDVTTGCPTVPSEGSRMGVKYVAAAGTVIANEGEKNVKTQTAEGHVCGIKIQIAKVKRAMLSVSKICDAGHEVTFNRTGGQIVHNSTGQVVKFRRVDGAYRLKVKVMRERTSGFTRPGM